LTASAVGLEWGVTDVTVIVAGEAGLGIQSATAVLTRVMARGGYHVFAYPDVMSRIRGGHNFFRIRISERPVAAIASRAGVVLAFDRRSVEEHGSDLVPGGVMIAEGEGSAGRVGEGALLPVPMTALARKTGAGPAAAGTVALGALCAVNGHPLRLLQAALAAQFERKGADVVRQNQAAAQSGFDHARRAFKGACPCLIPEVERPEPKLLFTGGQAIGLGALAGGVQFYAGYPMSPSTPILEYLAGKAAESGVVVEQAEDEVSVINMVCGAAYAGARAMTATSGGGFSLMVEGLGLAGMAELPLVVVLAQRPGPATGFPTRTEQADLLFATDCSQDEFPRFVLAPGTAEQAFNAVRRAFELATRYQVPALVLVDQYLVESLWTAGDIRLPATGRAAAPQSGGLRYEVGESGVSPWLVPGRSEQPVCSMGSEHDEAGLPSEDAGNRTRMMEKRMRKRVGMEREFGDVQAYPETGEECMVVCFGTTWGPVREAVDALRAERVRVGMLHFSELVPFPAERARQRLAGARRIVSVENNAFGQLARLFAREAGIEAHERVLKYDGRPFSGEEVAERLRGLWR
jgi:2-oxoglutarate ferredoxin oxidoreductase subunit alpha